MFLGESQRRRASSDQVSFGGSGINLTQACRLWAYSLREFTGTCGELAALADAGDAQDGEQ